MINNPSYLAQILGPELYAQVPDPYNLISHSGQVLTIQPWAMLFSPEGMMALYPYEVYNADYELLYRVSNHQQIFGQSSLDLALVLEAQTGQVYYLNYISYSGTRTIALVVDKTPTSIKLQAQLPNYLGTPQNSLFLTAVDGGYLNYSQPGAPPYPISVWYIPADPAIIPGLTSLPTIYDQPVLNLSPTASGWLVIKQNNQPLYLTVDSGSGGDRLIHRGNGFYYLVLGNDTNQDILRQSLGIPNLFSTESAINLQISMRKTP